MLLLIVTGILPITSVYAADQYLEQLVIRAQSAQLSNTRAWRALVHYKPGFFTDWTSQADDNAFFLSVSGKANPSDELIATLRAMNMAVTTNEHPQCRFPARYYWLKQVLNIDESKIITVKCNELDEWFETIKPGSLSLIFPSAYVNSPSSMFGHTLLRVNPDDYRKDAPLVGFALNYAADADATDNTLAFTIKGLIGGYPGVFSIVPYYKKIKEYSDIENRDVWEYSLNFTQQEIDQLMRHAWELRHIRFDYYFLTENCSYHMLSLMEVARPELDLTSAFDIKAIPSDTVRAVIDNKLVTEFHYRPSSSAIISQHSKQMSFADNKLVIKIANRSVSVSSEVLKNRTNIDRARIYEQSYDYLRFLATSDPTVRDVNAKINWQLLADRSQIPIANIWHEIEKPLVRAENGHSTGRIAIGGGVLVNDKFTSLQFRPAYHDVVDPPAGYTKGAQINFLDLNIRYYSQTEKFQLQKFTAINVLSLTPRDIYFKPLSWGIDVAVERQPTKSSMTNAAQAVVNLGYSSRLQSGATGSVLAEVNVKASRNFEKGYTLGTGIKAGLLKQSNHFSLLTNIKSIYFGSGENNLHHQADVELAYHLNNENSARMIFKRIRDYGKYRSDFQLAFQMYF